MNRTAIDLAAASGIEAERLAAWLEDDAKQLNPAEQGALMPAIGLADSALPEILIREFRKSGYLPEVLLNFIALLGWSPGGDRERMTTQEMIELFSLGGIGKSNARFNRDKLLAFNTEAAAEATPDRLVAAMRTYLSANPDSPLNQATDEQLNGVLEMNKGFRVLREVDEKSRFFFIADEAIEYDPKAVKKVLHKNEAAGWNLLGDLLADLRAAHPWDAASLESLINRIASDRGVGLGQIAQPIRVAICGTAVSPPIFQSLEFLGQEATVARIERAIQLNRPG
jgi:glutamyl-tRNA synthetase